MHIFVENDGSWGFAEGLKLVEISDEQLTQLYLLDDIKQRELLRFMALGAPELLV